MEELDGKVQQLEEDVKLLKNEVKSVLTDIEDYVLNYRSPFTATGAAGPSTTVVLNQPGDHPAPGDEGSPNGQPLDEASEEETEEMPQEASPLQASQEANGTTPGLEEEAVHPAQEAYRPPPALEDNAMHMAQDGQGITQPQGGQSAQEPETAPLDLETIIALSQWVKSTTRKIGQRRLQAILDICYSAGRLAEQPREVLLGLVQLAEDEESVLPGPVSMRICMAILAQLYSILQQQNKPNPGLLSLIFDLAQE